MTYPNLPASVTIDGVTYRIIVDDNIDPDPERKSQGYREDGEFDAALQEIRLRPGMSLDYARHILVHETLGHGCWEHAGLTAAGGPMEVFEEQIVTALARRWIGFLRDNPEFLAFVTGRDT